MNITVWLWSRRVINQLACRMTRMVPCICTRKHHAVVAGALLFTALMVDTINYNFMLYFNMFKWIFLIIDSVNCQDNEFFEIHFLMFVFHYIKFVFHLLSVHNVYSMHYLYSLWCLVYTIVTQFVFSLSNSISFCFFCTVWYEAVAFSANKDLFDLTSQVHLPACLAFYWTESQRTLNCLLSPSPSFCLIVNPRVPRNQLFTTYVDDNNFFKYTFILKDNDYWITLIDHIANIHSVRFINKKKIFSFTLMYTYLRRFNNRLSSL